ncbi:LacI family DNA-binding transcriptional regulator [Microbacterium sp. ARD31]|jgi:LacI family transcriptional regulator|uniref:LacI family DNA-binding transcriptional regulator n=1 Tax=Microbacterium sp. ARD31 TaxID=2962576 RepID=UPI002882B266|nr:LacI family DNA-binding transcriptional regulator [Microbacterium sp. ARD31]MDT0183927.1 LacI family DNA-binding transcriptional regulator [Microbacterium sp. ARD31]
MGRRPTIHDVAAEAGVSVSTVSKAVNGRYGIAADTVQRVLDVVERLGYESSLVASSMRSFRTGVIGVLVADFEPFSAEILKGVAQALHSTRYDLLAYSGSRQADSTGWERRSLSRLSGTLIDGAIMVTPTVVSASVDVPIVAIDPHTGRADLPTVESDSYHGALDAMEYLLGLGHRRIGFLAGRPDLRSAAARDAGYRKSLRDAGIEIDPALVRNGMYLLETARDEARVMLSNPRRPSAVFCANDMSAIALMEVAGELGIRVPEDLSVVGFDDVPEAARVSPGLTTVRQPMRRLGALAAEYVTGLLAGEQPPSLHVQLPTKLVVRGSTGPPPVS